MFSDLLQAITTASRAREKFRLAGGAQPLLLLPVRVNERGPYEFILDPGAGTSILTPELADSLGIKSTGAKQGHTAGDPVDVRLAMVDSLGVGAVRRTNSRSIPALRRARFHPSLRATSVSAAARSGQPRLAERKLP